MGVALPGTEGATSCDLLDCGGGGGGCGLEFIVLETFPFILII